MAPTYDPALLNLDITLGCVYLAGIFTSMLWSVGCLQLWLYLEKYSKTDQRWFKGYILVIWALDTAHQVILLKSYYVIFVKGIADPTLLVRTQKSLASVVIITALIDCMVQSIFVRRKWYIGSKNTILTGILAILVLAQFVITTAYFSEAYKFLKLTQVFSAVGTERAINCAILFTDTSIAVAMIWLLRKSRSGLKGMDTLIKRLVAYTIGTGLIISLCMIVALVGAEVAPDLFITSLAYWVIPKLYFNCVLALLNARQSLRSTLGNEEISFRVNDVSRTGGSSEESTGTPYEVSDPHGVACGVDQNIEVITVQKKKLDNGSCPSAV